MNYIHFGHFYSFNPEFAELGLWLYISTFWDFYFI